MTEAKLIALVSLLLSTFTIFIAFCIYNQEKSTQAWLAENVPHKKSHNVLLIGGVDEGGPDPCDTTCCIKGCHTRNSAHDFAAGLHFVSKLITNGTARCAQPDALTCAGDSLQGLGSFDKAILHYQQAIKCNESDAHAVVQLSFLFLETLNQPHETVALLEPYYSTGAVAALAPIATSNLQMACVYTQAFMRDQSTIPRMLQHLEVLRGSKMKFDVCLYVLQHRALSLRRYNADAYQYSKEFVRQYPTRFESHAAMGEALLALGRKSEATAVLNVSFDLLNAQLGDVNGSNFISHRTRIEVQWKLADALNACGSVDAALSVYSMLIARSSEVEEAKLCVLFTKVGGIYFSQQNYNKAYVALLQSSRVCRVDLSGQLLLGKVQHKLGLLHDATDSLQRAALNSALQEEASAALQAVKDTVQEGRLKEAAEAEAKMGPRPPHDPSVVRREPTGTFVEFLARREKEKAAEEDRAKELAERTRIERRAVKSEATPVATFVDSQTVVNVTSETVVLVDTAYIESVDNKSVGSSVDHSALPATIEAPAASASISLTPMISNDSLPEASPGAITSSQIEAPITQEQREPTTEVIDSNSLNLLSAAEVPQLPATEVAARKVADQYIIMARAYLERKDTDQALKQLNKAAKRAPTYSESYLARGQVYASAGATEKAAEDFLKVYTELDPLNEIAANSLKQLAADLALAGQLESANNIFAAVKATMPRDEAFSLSLAAVLGNKGEYSQALGVLDNIDPPRPSTARRVGLYVQLHELQGSPDRAERVLADAVAEHILPWSHLGVWYVKNKILTKAVKAYERHLQAVMQGSAPLLPGSGELAVLHKQIGSLYSRMHEESSVEHEAQVRADSLSEVDAAAVPPAEGTASTSLAVIEEQRQEYPASALEHFLEAMKGGIYDVEMRRFFARNPQLSSPLKTVQDNDERGAASLAGTSVDDTVKELVHKDELVTGTGKAAVEEESEQEILQQLQGFEPSALKNTVIEAPTNKAKDAQGGAAEKSESDAAAGAAVTPSTALHSRRSRWVVKHLSAVSATASTAEAATAAPELRESPVAASADGHSDAIGSQATPSLGDRLRSGAAPSIFEGTLHGQEEVQVEAGGAAESSPFEVLLRKREAEQEVEEAADIRFLS